MQTFSISSCTWYFEKHNCSFLGNIFLYTIQPLILNVYGLVSVHRGLHSCALWARDNSPMFKTVIIKGSTRLNLCKKLLIKLLLLEIDTRGLSDCQTYHISNQLFSAWNYAMYKWKYWVSLKDKVTKSTVLSLVHTIIFLTGGSPEHSGQPLA